MPHTNGTPDRIVHDDASGGGGTSTRIVDSAGNELDVQPDGSINVNTAVNVGSVEVVDSGGHELDVQPDGSINVNVAGGGGPVSIADGADVNAGSTTDVAETSDSDGTLSSKLRGLVKWAYERMPSSLGQKLMAASFPVTLASDQSDVPISAASLPLPTGAATAANQQTDALTDGQLRATAVPVSAASLPLPTGAATAANQQTDALTDGQLRASAVPVDTELPAAAALADNTGNPTVPGVGAFGMVWDGANWDRLRGTSSDGMFVSQLMDTNGRVDGLTNSAGRFLGQGGVIPYQDVFPYIFNGTTWDRLRGDSTNGMDVDVTRLPAGSLANGAETAVAGTAVQILASDASRKHAIIQNTGAANIRVGITGVTATTGLRLIPGAIASLPVTTAIYAIREGATSSTAFAQNIT